MKVERIVYPIYTLGPGKRVVIWTIGCPHHCPFCINPELQVSTNQKQIEVNKLASILIKLNLEEGISRLTLTGGDPFYQNDELKELLKLIRPYFDDILVYTGYLKQELDENTLSLIDVLIDGKYEDDKNEDHLALRGSSNQTIYYLNQNLKEQYEAYLKGGRKIQNIFLDGTLLSVGIHNKIREDI